MCISWYFHIQHVTVIKQNTIFRKNKATLFVAREIQLAGPPPCNEELNVLYCSPSIVRVIKLRRMRWAGHVARMGERRGMYRVLVGKAEGKRQLGRHRRRWEDNIKMTFQKWIWEYGLD
jgi:hypothetical protein